MNGKIFAFKEIVALIRKLHTSTSGTYQLIFNPPCLARMRNLAELKKNITVAVENSDNEKVLEAIQDILNNGLYTPDQDEMEQLAQSDLDEASGNLFPWEDVKAKLDQRDFTDAD